MGTNELWEKVNKKCDEDILDIVTDLINQNVTAGETANRIAKRCDIAIKVFTEKLQNNNKQLREKIQIVICNINGGAVYLSWVRDFLLNLLKETK